MPEFIHIIREFSGDIPILLIGNKADKEKELGIAMELNGPDHYDLYYIKR